MRRRATQRMAQNPPVQRPQRPQRAAQQAQQYAPTGQRPRRAANPTRVLRPRPQPKRRVWPVLLGGCALGIFAAVLAAGVVVFLGVRGTQTGGVPIIGAGGLGGGTQTFTSDATQAITLTSLAQLQVCDKTGNVSVVLDPNATTASIKTTKTVHTTSKGGADQEFGRITVAIQQSDAGTQSLACTASSTAGTPTTGGATGGTLFVNTVIPNTDGLIRSAGDAVDIKITLTQKLLTSAGVPPQLTIQAALGNITVDGIASILHIIGNSGNVTVTRATLISGSSIGTGQGNVTLNGLLAAPSDSTTAASFIVRSETGKIDVTLAPSTNVVLSANTNAGTIHSDFPVTATASGSSTSYRGPLNTTATSQSAAVLTLDVGTGDITIHKGQG